MSDLEATDGEHFVEIGHPKQRAFLVAYTECAVITEAAQIAGIRRQSHYHWMRTDETYAAAFARADEEALEVAEREAHRRAIDGVQEPVWHKGKIVGYQLRYSDPLLIVILKARAPAKYRERTSIEHAGPEGKPIPLDVVVSARERLREQLDEGAKRLEAGDE